CVRPFFRNVSGGPAQCLRRATRSFQEKHSQTGILMVSRDEVLAVVLRNMVDTVEELEDVEVDPAQSMVDLGVNSLDIVEIVSCSMRELKIKVPRAELKTLENINMLVDLLHRVVVEKAQL